MNNRVLTFKQLTAYQSYLRREERANGTVEKYLRDIRAFFCWLNGRPVTKELAHGWKDYLLSRHYAPITVNSMLSAVNGLLHFLDWDDCRVKFLKIQRRLFREEQRELSRLEYDRLLETARALGRERLGPADGDDLRHRHPGIGSTLHYCGGRTEESGRNYVEREDPNHSDSEQALPEAAEIRQKAKGRLW